jgi:hypothetical protein
MPVLECNKNSALELNFPLTPQIIVLLKKVSSLGPRQTGDFHKQYCDKKIKQNIAIF